MISFKELFYQFTCAKKAYVGGKREDDVDGAYYLCKDDVVWPFPSKTEAPCLVYSFGINWDFKFDDEMAKLGCEVHAFDPCKSVFTFLNSFFFFSTSTSLSIK